ncbi:threonine/serine exporter family protein [uncultured Endozoicomonas sp.]|uniref:threonine/serine ThrE exporter family protein n=1 Tax=uncultured Endozoicomonas sp. TaxID=432652 RepID=UPI00260EA10C|nr:threonine/serine exporter family protein [uncultured Endozoicomonas sp.]
MNTGSQSACSISAHKSSCLLLDAAVLLMASGAHTERVNRNLKRLAAALGFEVELFFSLSGITLTLSDHRHEPITAFRKVPAYGVQLSVVSAISRLSWKAMEEQMPFDSIEKEIQRIRTLPHYPKPLVIMMIALAGMAFCRVSGADYLSVALAGVATALGFYTRNLLLQKHYTLPICVAMAAFVASGISGIGYISAIIPHPEIAVATSVLFLIPGIPMINSIVDLVHGHIITGQGRAMQAIVISMAIAMGITLSSALLGALIP